MPVKRTLERPVIIDLAGLSPRRAPQIVRISQNTCVIVAGDFSTKKTEPESGLVSEFEDRELSKTKTPQILPTTLDMHDIPRIMENHSKSGAKGGPSGDKSPRSCTHLGE